MNATTQDPTKTDATANGHGDPAAVPPPGDAPGSDDTTAIVIDGDGQLSLSIGGAKPDMATFHIAGKKIDVATGDFKKGDLLKFEIVVKVGEVHVMDKLDLAGEVTQTTRKHVGKIIAIDRTDA